jgi:hypothetical protein
MKKIFFALALCAITTFIFSKANAQSDNSSPAVLRHIVMITFKQDAPADSIKSLDDLYMSLSKSPLVKDFEMGVNISTRDSGVIKHVYVTSFASKEDMDNYRKMPAYSKLFKVSLPISEEVTVADYWAKK